MATPASPEFKPVVEYSPEQTRRLLGLSDEEFDNLTEIFALRNPPVLSRNLDDLAFPGVMVELDPDVADWEGFSIEDAVSFEDAYEANADLIEIEG